MNYLTFFETAKYVDIVLGLINGFGYGNNFSFWSSTIFEPVKNKTLLLLLISLPSVIPTIGEVSVGKTGESEKRQK